MSAYYDVREHVGPLIDEAIKEVAPYDNVMWDLCAIMKPVEGGFQLVPVLCLSKPSPIIGRAVMGGTEVDHRQMLDPEAVKRAVRHLMEQLRNQEHAIATSMRPPNGQARP